MLNQLRKIHQEAKVADKKRKHNKCSGTDIPGTSGSNYEPPAKHQTTIESILIKKVRYINDHRSQEIHYLIGEMITVDIQPYSVTPDIGFNKGLLQNLVQIIVFHQKSTSRKKYFQIYLQK